MGYVGTYDRTIFYNPNNKYCIISVKTSDQSVPQQARSAYRHRDNMIRFIAVGYTLLRNCKQQYTGTARLGIEAIEWKVRGLSGAEIAKMYGVKPNLVGAWISRASQRLRQNQMFMQYFDRTVEIDSS